MEKTVKLQGVCAQSATFEVTDGILTKCKINGGCPGNSVGVAKLAVGRPVAEVIELLRGIQCRNGTSCPDQLARALEADGKVVVP